jgi:hypothetical protein
MSGRAIFLYQLFLFCVKTMKHHQVTKAVSSTHFWVFVKIYNIQYYMKKNYNIYYINTILEYQLICNTQLIV